jgi:hypothetical protein
MPGMIVLPRASICFAPEGIGTLRPTAAMRLPSTITVPFSMTSAALPAGWPPRPAARMMRAPTKAIAPDGASDFVLNPMLVPFASGSSAFERF